MMGLDQYYRIGEVWLLVNSGGLRFSLIARQKLFLFIIYQNLAINNPSDRLTLTFSSSQVDLVMDH